ncbi:28S ribosomal protein S9, mitochondrial [Tanacetum coccineum]
MNQALLSTTIKGHRYFSTENNDNNNNKSSSSSWNISSSSLGEQSIESLFSFNAIQEQQQDEKEDNEKKQEEEEDNRLLDEEGNSLSDGHRYFSTENNDNNNNKSWNISSLGEGEQNIESFFSFNTIIQQVSNSNDGNDNDEVFALSGQVDNEKKQEEENRLLDEEAKSLSDDLMVKDKKLELNSSGGARKCGPDHAFGDLIAASGITDDMLDSLMALKDLDDVPGLPPLSAIEDMHYEKNTRVDRQGRAYGTGKRKCSIARVWIEPGEGKFLINDNQFDVYFPMLDQRAALLRPLTETKTLGLLDINCTVKGGGVSGLNR